jgi:hypothetical protein
MSHLLGAFGLLDFTMLRLVLDWLAFWSYEPLISLIFQFFRAALKLGHSISGYGGTAVFRFVQDDKREF